jgi:hypothetical protein
MFKFRVIKNVFLLTLLVIGVFSASPASVAFAGKQEPEPEPFVQVGSAKGVSIYSRKLSADVLVLVNLQQGASVEFLTGGVAGKYGKGMFGGSNLVFNRQPLSSFISQAKKKPNWVCVGNGSVFAARTSPKESPNASALHYSLRSGNILTEGQGETVRNKKTSQDEPVEFGLVQIWQDFANILRVDPKDPLQIEAARGALYGTTTDSTAKSSSSVENDPFLRDLFKANGKELPNALPTPDPFVSALIRANGIKKDAGPAQQVLGAVFRRAEKESYARSLLYVLDTDKDLFYETLVYAHISPSPLIASREKIEPFLATFGNFDFVSLDGGGLSQLVCNTGGVNFVSECSWDRTCWLPQAVGIYAAP